jgi:hypothetical protein
MIACRRGSTLQGRSLPPACLLSYPEQHDHEFLLKLIRPDELLNEIERPLGSAP